MPGWVDWQRGSRPCVAAFFLAAISAGWGRPTFPVSEPGRPATGPIEQEALAVVSGLTSDDAHTTKPCQRRCIYAGGRWWWFRISYTSSGTEAYWSTNGTTWSAAIDMDGGLDIDLGGVWYQAPYIYVFGNESVVTPPFNNDDLTIARINVTDLTVTTHADIISNYGDDQDTGFCISSSGIFWVANEQNVWSSATWNSGYAIWSETNEVFEMPILVPLDGGKIYLLHGALAGAGIDDIYGRLYNGTSWEGTDTLIETDAEISNGQYSLTVDSSYNLHLVYLNSAQNGVFYRKGTQSGGTVTWSAAVTISTTLTGCEGATITYYSPDDQLWVFTIADAPTNDNVYVSASYSATAQTGGWSTWLESPLADENTIANVSSNFSSEATVMASCRQTTTVQALTVGPRTWLGGSSTAWGTAANWWPNNTVPTGSDSAYIENLLRTNTTCDLGANRECRSITIPAGSTVTPTSFTLEVGGSFKNTGTFTASTSTVLMNEESDSPDPTSISTDDPFNNLQIIGTPDGLNKTTSLLTAMTVNGSFYIQNATFAAGANAVTILGTLAVNGTPNLGAAASRARWTGTGNVTVRTAYWRPGSDGTISAGTWTLTGAALNPDWLFNGVSGITPEAAPDMTGSTVIFQGTNDSSVEMIEFAGISTTAKLGHVQVGSATATNKTMRLTFASYDGGPIVAGDLTITASNSLSLNNTTGGQTGEAIRLRGNWTNNGSLLFDLDTTVEPNGPGVIIFDGSGPQTIASGGTGAGKTFGRMVVSQTVASTVSLSANAIATTQSLTVTSGTLNLAALTGSTVGTDLTINGGTIQFGSAAQNPSITVSGNFAMSSGGLTMNSATDLLTIAGTVSFSGGTTTLTDGDIDVAGSFTLSAGTLDAGGSTLQVAGDWTNNATFTPGTGTVTFDGGTQSILGSSGTTFYNLTVATGSTTTVNPTGAVNTDVSNTLSVAGTLAMANSKTLRLEGSASISGTFRTTSGASSKPVVTRITTDFAFTISGTTDIDGLDFSFADAAGLNVTGAITKLRNIRFTSGTSRHLTLATSGNVDSPGCYFQGGLTNVVASSTGTLYIRFESRSDAENGTGRGEANDSDNDADDNGIPVPATGAVVLWVVAAGTQVTGTVDIDPTTGMAVSAYVSAAYNTNTGAYVATYMVTRDYSAGADRIWVLDAQGNLVGTPYDVPAANGDVVGTPLWYTLDPDGGGNDQLLFLGTTTGYIYCLKNVGGVLSLVSGWGIKPAGLDEVTSPMTTDGVNVYFGGEDAANAPKIFAVDVSTLPTVQFTVAITTAMRTFPSLAGSPARLFAGSDASGSIARCYRIDVPGQLLDAENTLLKAHHIRNAANLTFITSAYQLFVGDWGGRVHKIDAFGTFSLNVWVFEDVVTHGVIGPSPGPTIAAVYSMVYTDPGGVYYGDDDGHVYKLTQAGAKDGGWSTNPIQPDSTNKIMSTPLLDAGNSLWIGNNNGKLWKINPATGAILKTYDLGAGVKVGDLSADNSTLTVMIVTSSGRIYYIPQ